jgi:hypothetical protein
VGDLDHTIRRNVHHTGSKAYHSLDFLKRQYTRLKDGNNLALFKELIFLGPDIDLIPQRKFRVLIKNKYFKGIGAKMLHLFFDNFPDGQSTRLLFLGLIHRLHIFVIRIFARIEIMVVVLFEDEVLGRLLFG